MHLYSAIYFSSSFGHYSTFHTLKSVGRKSFQYAKRMFPLFRAIVKFCSTNGLSQLLLTTVTSSDYPLISWLFHLISYTHLCLGIIHQVVASSTVFTSLRLGIIYLLVVHPHLIHLFAYPFTVQRGSSLVIAPKCLSQPDSSLIPICV